MWVYHGLVYEAFLLCGASRGLLSQPAGQLFSSVASLLLSYRLATGWTAQYHICLILRIL